MAKEYLFWIIGWALIGISIGAMRKKPRRSLRRIIYSCMGALAGAAGAWWFLHKFYCFAGYLWIVGSTIVLISIYLFLKISELRGHNT